MRAIVLMLVSVACWSMFPVLGALTVGRADPFAFIAKAWFQGAVGAFVLFVVMAVLRRRAKLSEVARLVLGPRSLAMTWLASLANISSHALLFASFLFINKAAATTIYETWPLVVAYVIPLVIKNKFKRFGAAEIIYGLVGLSGLALLTFDAATTAPAPGIVLFGLKPEIVGVLLAFVASACQATGTSTYAVVVQRAATAEAPLRAILIVQLMYCALGSLMLGGLLAALGRFDWSGMLSIDYATAYGIGILLIGNVSFFLAVHYAANSGVVLLWYVTPILSLLLLFLLGLSSFTIVVMVAATLIIISNILANFPGDRTLAYAATMIAIGVSATLNFTGVRPTAVIDAEIVAVPASVFAILAAFLMERVASRKVAQESHALDLFIAIAEARKQHPDAADIAAEKFLGVLDAPNGRPADVQIAQLRAHLRERLPTLQYVLTRYEINRSETLSFGELMILWIVGFATIIAAQLSLPVSFVGEILVIVLTAAVAFMCFNVLDQTNLSGHGVLFRFAMEERGHAEAGELKAVVRQQLYWSISLTAVLLAAYLAALIYKYRADLLFVTQ
jgi:drug/metabolite transporter (DMT)-like permease